MTKRILLLLGLLSIIKICAFGQTRIQCDSIKISRGEFDKLFQNEYNIVEADTILAIRHCYSTNGCPHTFGLLCWKTNGQFYFKKIESKNDKTKSTSKLNKELIRQLISFYEKEVYRMTGSIDEKEKLIIDDGPYTRILFKTKDRCWQFGYSYSNSNDIRVLWTQELLTIMR